MLDSFNAPSTRESGTEEAAPLRDSEQYRDQIGTVDSEGKRIWIYPRKPSGRFYNARTIVSIFLLGFLFGAPFIKIGGQPLILMNVLERKFIIFGLAFWPQDFHLFALALLTFVVFVILFTVIFGRVFCGWACPQTIFMEMVFRKIEYWIEGDAQRQRKLNKSPWTAQKIGKKFSKWAIFAAISFLIGNTLLAYIIGVDELYRIVTDPPSQHIGGLTAMIIFSAVFFFIFTWFREQACVMVCPYGRLQGVLLDPSSIVVAYDPVRGEPRGKRRRNADTTDLGDCIDCHLCVQVCPTGIDIRNGTQLECVNCTACIDACDSIMDKVKKPRGLIRYDSYKGIMEGVKLQVTPRIIGYSAVLTVLLGLLAFLLGSRVPVETTILRTPGMQFQEVPGEMIQNLYNVRVVNKSFEARDITLKLRGIDGEIQPVSGEVIRVAEDALSESVLFIRIPRSALKAQKTQLQIEVYSGGELLEVVETGFMGPTL